MSRIRAGTALLLGRIARLGVGRLRAGQSDRDDLIAVASAIHARALAGEQTSLRQLHTVTGLSQCAALKAVAELEQTEMLVIDQEMLDALGSTITLAPQMQSRLEQIDKRNAA